MSEIYREDHELFRQQVRRFVETEIAPNHYRWEKKGIVPRDVWLKAGAAGLLCCDVPEEYGGGGGDFGHSAVVVEELMRVNATGVGFPTHSITVAPYIMNFGTEEQKRKWLPGMASGEVISAVAMTEPGAGSDLKAIKASAEKVGDAYVINGQKTFITNGINADIVVVVCRTDPSAAAKGISLIVVERGTEGFTRGSILDKIGFKAQDTAELFFDSARVPVENLLGKENEGFACLMLNLPQERLLIAIRAIAILESMLDETIDYTRQRTVFGKSVFDFQSNRFKLASAKAEVVMLRSYVNDCLERHLRGGLTALDAAMVKLTASRMATRLLDDLMQMFGGYGYMAEYLIGKAWVDSRLLRLFGGTDEIMQEIVARSL
ncbi:acyl-CoA dehydrogenase family protein [Castellaniella sp. WN]